MEAISPRRVSTRLPGPRPQPDELFDRGTNRQWPPRFPDPRLPAGPAPPPRPLPHHWHSQASWLPQKRRRQRCWSQRWYRTNQCPNLCSRHLNPPFRCRRSFQRSKHHSLAFPARCLFPTHPPRIHYRSHLPCRRGRNSVRRNLSCRARWTDSCRLLQRWAHLGSRSCREWRPFLDSRLLPELRSLLGLRQFLLRLAFPTARPRPSRARSCSGTACPGGAAAAGPACSRSKRSGATRHQSGSDNHANDGAVLSELKD